jgi:hypothetical protein
MRDLNSIAGAGRGVASHSGCYISPVDARSRISWKECAFGVGSQLSGHAACLLTGICNAVAGGISTANGHDLWSAFLVGTTIYALSVLVRFLWSGDRLLPSLKMAAFGLAFGVAVSAGFGAVRSFSHHQEMASWFQSLSDADRQQVRGKVRQWMERQSPAQRRQLTEAAQLMGYEYPEDFVVLSYCSTSNRELVAIWAEVQRPFG